MKIAPALSFMLSFIMLSNSLGAQEFFPPREEDLLAVSLNLLEESKKLTMNAPEKDCEEKKTVDAPKKVEPAEGQELFCICELNGQGLKAKDVKKLWPIVGEIESIEGTLTTGNDNFFHGGAQRIDSLKPYDGDDRGRTFGGGLNYRIIGSEGELKLSLDSTGFGKFTPQNGYRKDPNGRYYLNFSETNTVGLKLDKNIAKNENSKTFLTGEFQFINQTDSGNLSRAAQEWWHDVTNKMTGGKIIQYNYIKEREDQNTVLIMGGVGKEWINNLGNWKCQSRAELAVGMSYGTGAMMSAEAKAFASNTISHRALPWVALSTWLQGSAGVMGPAASGGIQLSMEKKIKNVTIKPFIGVERHFTDKDKTFGQVSGKPYENYHVLGVTIKY